jgi:hypothetical protein
MEEINEKFVTASSCHVTQYLFFFLYTNHFTLLEHGDGGKVGAQRAATRSLFHEHAA